MIQRHTDPARPWHAPERAWTPLMWIIAAVAIALSVMVLAPLAPVVSAAANGAVSPAASVEPNVALAEAAKALARWPAAPPERAASGGSVRFDAASAY